MNIWFQSDNVDIKLTVDGWGINKNQHLPQKINGIMNSDLHLVRMVSNLCRTHNSGCLQFWIGVTTGCSQKYYLKNNTIQQRNF